MIVLDVVAPSVIPDWATVLVFVIVPITTLVIALSGFYFVLLQIITLRTKVDGRLTELIASNDAKADAAAKVAFEKGIAEGKLREQDIAKAVADRLLIEEGLKALGAKALLEAQATAAAISAAIQVPGDKASA